MRILNILRTPKRSRLLWIGVIVFWGTYLVRSKHYLEISDLYFQHSASTTSSGMLLIASGFIWIIGIPFWLFIAGVSFGNYQGALPLFGTVSPKYPSAHIVNILCSIALVISISLNISMILHANKIISRPEFHQHIGHVMVGLVASLFWSYLWPCIRVMTINRINLHKESKLASS